MIFVQICNDKNCFEYNSIYIMMKGKEDEIKNKTKCKTRRYKG
jgi:hypothetical protein